VQIELPAEDALAMQSECKRARTPVFEPYTLFRAPPMAGRYINVAEWGYRLGKRGETWPPDANATNIFVFGGSTAFGYGVADEETIPSALADHLDQMLPARRIGVYNFASPNYTSVQERIRLEQLLLDGHTPSVAAFIDGFDEFVGPYYEAIMFQPFVDAIPRPAPARLVGSALRSMALSATRGWRRGTRSSSEDEAFNFDLLPDPRRVLERWRKNKEMIQAVCRSFGVRPLFVWQPIPCFHYDASDGSHSHPGSEPLLEVLRVGYERMGEQRGSPEFGEEFLWLADIQVGRSENLYVDADHYTPAFSSEIARRLAEYLIAHQLADRAEP
jgi:hypothetical protein